MSQSDGPSGFPLTGPVLVVCVGVGPVRVTLLRVGKVTVPPYFH